MLKFLPPILFIMASQLAGVIGSFFIANSVRTWYLDINKPAFNPPSWVFGPVWITLYTLMGIAAYLVWKEWGISDIAKYATILFFVHLIFNSLWLILFFGIKNPAWAFFEIIILWFMILALIILYYQVNKTAAIILIPYILWVSFAAILNFFIWRLNL